MTKKRLITEADVRAAAAGGPPLDVPAGAIITPAARDTADQLGVELKAGHGEQGHGGTGAEGQIGGSFRAPVPQSPSAPPLVGSFRAPLPPSPSAPPLVGSFRAPLPPSPSAPPLVALGADHGGFPMKEALKPLLEELGFEVLDLGTSSTGAVDYPDFAEAVARAVAEGRAARGIMIDGAGIGSAMVANKVPGVRAALCHDLTTALNAREHNDANVLTLGGTLIGQRLAGDIVKAFLVTDFGGGRHQARVDKINRLD